MKAAVLNKATVGDAVDAVKESIVRGLCSRAGELYELQYFHDGSFLHIMILICFWGFLFIGRNFS